MSLVNQNMHVVSDGILLIADIARNAYKGTRIFTKLWGGIAKKLDIKFNIDAFVINKYDRRNGLSDSFVEYCRSKEELKDILLQNVIPENIELKKAETKALPINLFNTKCAGYQAYKDVYDELIERGVF
jgi:chromosome partitioning protein